VKTIKVIRVVGAPIDRVFARLSDHEGYARFPGVRSARLLKVGTIEKNGVGAVREIASAFMSFDEEITGFDRPRRMDYRIIRSRPAIDHKGGSIELETVDGGTRVTWTSTLQVKTPVLANVLTKIAAAIGARAFDTILREVDKELRA
jgi:uncharacterized protein YndB with AHSA1/START domain